MPNFDRTGPSGQGPMTGRRQGKCVDNNRTKSDTEKQSSQDDQVLFGLGRGGRPWGGGRRNRFGGGWRNFWRRKGSGEGSQK